jgi:hypothetical protein
MIRSLSYEDLDSGWKLQEMTFADLNLLVGPSGAGKTRILEALLDIRKAALRGARGVPSSRWKIALDVDDQHFVWEAETEVTRAELPESGKVYDVSRRNEELAERTDARFVDERIQCDGRVLAERNGAGFKFGDERLPRITESESAIKLFEDEDKIRPLHESLQIWRRLEGPFSSGVISSVASAEDTRRALGGNLEKLQSELHLPTFLKFYVLEKDHREAFARVVEDFIDVFPTVEQLKVSTYDDLGFRPNLGESFMASSLAVGLREEGVEGWIPHVAFSSGMSKTLRFLIETELAPKGTVFLIDELENSLGVNCLPEVAGRMLERLDRIQYVATSHHPRVINEIPFDRWKLVTRKGSTVQVLDAKDIEPLRSVSSLERFTELINLPEYVEGVT